MYSDSKTKSIVEAVNLNLTVYHDPIIIRTLKDKWIERQDDDLALLEYCTALAGSSSTKDKYEALEHFQYLAKHSSYRRESVYNIALLYYALGEINPACAWCQELYKHEPENAQVKRLHTAIRAAQEEQRMHQEKQKDIVIGTGVGLAFIGIAAVGLSLLLSKKK